MKKIIICDIDDTLGGPSEYKNFKGKATEKEHEIAQSDEFRRRLLEMSVFDWVEDKRKEFEEAERVVFLTGRWDYNSQVTVDWLKIHGLFGDNARLSCLNFRDYKEYIKNKVDQISFIYNWERDKEIHVYEDSRALVEMLIDSYMKIKIHLVKDGKLIENYNDLEKSMELKAKI